jgi:hypothetical protein
VEARPALLHGADPEWDIVADVIEGPRVLPVKSSRSSVTAVALKAAAFALSRRALPPHTAGREIVRALFVPRTAAGAPRQLRACTSSHRARSSAPVALMLPGFRGPGYGRTLLEAIASEGLADHFAVELLGVPVRTAGHSA